MTMTVPVVTSAAGRRAWPSLLHRVVRTIRSKGLIDRGEHLLVAVSGGPDSVALLSLLHRLQSSWSLKVSAAHCNYGLRGEESETDQKFVEAFCRERSISLYTRRLDVRDRPPRTSLQAAARDRRYEVLKEMADECGADRIAVGHTADDQAETVLLWLLRGAGLAGLSGMPAIREGLIIRPLYETSRRDIMEYLGQAGVPFREDSSNSRPLYLRNRIRHEVIPVLTRVWPSTVPALCRLADLCREDDQYLDRHAAAVSAAAVRLRPDGSWMIDRSCLEDLSVALRRRLVRDVLRRCDDRRRPPAFRTVERVLRTLAKRGGVRRIVVKSARLVIGRDRMQVIPAGLPKPVGRPPTPPTPERLTLPGRVTWTASGRTISVEEIPLKHARRMSRERDRIVVDADRLSGPFVVRAWKPGDRFHPLGMQGRSKKLQDYFTDAKVPQSARDRIPLVVAPEGIVWVVGYRQDERWRFTDATTRCLMISASGESTEEEGV